MLLGTEEATAAAAAAAAAALELLYIAAAATAAALGGVDRKDWVPEAVAILLAAAATAD